MTKRELAILEKVFVREVTGGLYQGHCKTIKKLEQEGYVVMIDKMVGKGWPGPIKVSGYVTTFKGNIQYCMSCKGE